MVHTPVEIKTSTASTLPKQSNETSINTNQNLPRLVKKLSAPPEDIDSNVNNIENMKHNDKINALQSLPKFNIYPSVPPEENDVPINKESTKHQDNISTKHDLPKTTMRSAPAKENDSNFNNKLNIGVTLPKHFKHSEENAKESQEKEVAGGGMPKVLIREDTVFTFNGCAGCGRGQFTCSGVQKQWSVLCWGRQSDRKYYTLLVLLSATFVLSLLGTVFFCFTNTLNDAILSNMVIRNNSLAYTLWRRPSVNPLMKVHIFNYTNWKEVRDGKETKLRVKECGPYVYSQQLERVNVKFDDDLLSFQERNQFHYLANETTGAHFDQLLVPNLPLLGVVSKAKTMNLNPLSLLSLNSALLAMADHPDAFVRLPVHRFLWGYDDTIIDLAKTYLRFQGEVKFDKFGLLATKNGTVSERFTINTGQHDMDKMNLIQQVDGRSHLNYWNDVECNKLDGSSDGSIFPPSMLDKKQTLYVFYPNLCRRLPFEFHKEVETYDGVILYRYRMPRNIFDDPLHNPANQCYCEMDAGVCPPRGVINVTACTMGAPAMVSFPHFFLGDPQVRDAVVGLHPDPALHDTYVDIHPKLGIALQGRSTLQINMEVRKPKFISAVNFLPEGLILPVAWIEMEVLELPESLRRLVYHGTYSTAALQLALTVLCVVALIVSSICLLLMLLQRRRRPCATIKKVAAAAVEIRDVNDSDKTKANIS